MAARCVFNAKSTMSGKDGGGEHVRDDQLPYVARLGHAIDCNVLLSSSAASIHIIATDTVQAVQRSRSTTERQQPESTRRWARLFIDQWLFAISIAAHMTVGQARSRKGYNRLAKH